MAEVGFLEIPFRQFYHTPSSLSNVARFSVSTQSLDRVWITYRDPAFATQTGLVPINGFKQKPAYASNTNVSYSSSAITNVGRPSYDAGGVYDTNKEKYQTAFFQLQEQLKDEAIPATYQLTVNSSQIPQYKANTVEMYAITKNSTDYNKTDHNMTLDQYRSNYFVQCVRFCMPDSSFSRLVSGLDTRSTSAQLSLITENLADMRLDIWCECHSTMRVGVGRAIEIIT